MCVGLRSSSLLSVLLAAVSRKSFHELSFTGGTGADTFTSVISTPRASSRAPVWNPPFNLSDTVCRSLWFRVLLEISTPAAGLESGPLPISMMTSMPIVSLFRRRLWPILLTPAILTFAGSTLRKMMRFFNRSFPKNSSSVIAGRPNARMTTGLILMSISPRPFTCTYSVFVSMSKKLAPEGDSAVGRNCPSVFGLL
ncbi:hypothetical protein NP493_337g00025 [Ridgeia piscesae]|uniref:Secreted protein n=1 Tax=Ridgeia piscesae TaxID=27915 RepID=A0AAD9L5A1_RIDPI|nr:hypothetical protein NP493_337g00025 [Ridgeia piscesae]